MRGRHVLRRGRHALDEGKQTAVLAGAGAAGNNDAGAAAGVATLPLPLLLPRVQIDHVFVRRAQLRRRFRRVWCGARATTAWRLTTAACVGSSSAMHMRGRANAVPPHDARLDSPVGSGVQGVCFLRGQPQVPGEQGRRSRDGGGGVFSAESLCCSARGDAGAAGEDCGGEEDVAARQCRAGSAGCGSACGGLGRGSEVPCSGDCRRHVENQAARMRCGRLGLR